jgi:hypothetical protein
MGIPRPSADGLPAWPPRCSARTRSQFSAGTIRPLASRGALSALDIGAKTFALRTVMVPFGGSAPTCPTSRMSMYPSC